MEDCNLFDGEWVFDNKTHPLYKENECEFLEDWILCIRIGDGSLEIVICPRFNISNGVDEERRGSFDEGSTAYDEIELPIAYERTLKTWANWVDNNVDPMHTSVFFTSMSPTHLKSLDWDKPDGIKCAKETTPILNKTRSLEVGSNHQLFRTAVNVTRSMIVPVYFLNVTTPSEYRKDAHTSIYQAVDGKLLSPEQRFDPLKYADCVHWCLPGLPDTWNELLYAHIITRS
ncbi:xylan O-acetyltransferase 1-like [Mercurialis annua]|uniref:xylan O-acetyltransferase 1-like n=1 Tax=Mercurialis annua TaxID=3986 RepID=UPI0024AFD728|nr:xylan O-acetyltransferase 1-like [Mercurialis annua]